MEWKGLERKERGLPRAFAWGQRARRFSLKRVVSAFRHLFGGVGVRRGGVRELKGWSAAVLSQREPEID